MWPTARRAVAVCRKRIAECPPSSLLLVEAALLPLAEIRVKGFPADLLLEPDFDIRRIAIGIVEGAGGDVHVFGPGGAAIADQAAAILAEHPVDSGRA